MEVHTTSPRTEMNACLIKDILAPREPPLGPKGGSFFFLFLFLCNHLPKFRKSTGKLSMTVRLIRCLGVEHRGWGEGNAFVGIINFHFRQIWTGRVLLPRTKTTISTLGCQNPPLSRESCRRWECRLRPIRGRVGGFKTGLAFLLPLAQAVRAEKARNVRTSF